MELLDVQNLASKLRALPLEYELAFTLSHMVICCLSVRKDATRSFGISNPAAAWASCMLTIFAGSLIANPLLGNSLVPVSLTAAE